MLKNAKTASEVCPHIFAIFRSPHPVTPRANLSLRVFTFSRRFPCPNRTPASSHVNSIPASLHDLSHTLFVLITPGWTLDVGRCMLSVDVFPLRPPCPPPSVARLACVALSVVGAAKEGLLNILLSVYLLATNLFAPSLRFNRILCVFYRPRPKWPVFLLYRPSIGRWCERDIPDTRCRAGVQDVHNPLMPCIVVRA